MGLLSDAVAELAELVTLRHRPKRADIPAGDWQGPPPKPILGQAGSISHRVRPRSILQPTHRTSAVISVFRCSDYIQAQLLAGLLREHGIGVFLQGALLQGGLGELPALGHLSLMVDDSDRAAAEQIIAAYERGDLKIDEEHPEQPVNDSDTG